MKSPYAVVKDFEDALCGYTGAPYAVTTNCCTMAIFLALKWHWQNLNLFAGFPAPTIIIPKHTYISVPMQAIHAGYEVKFHDEDWIGAYQLLRTPVWDCARRFTSDMYRAGQYQCVSFHWSKILGIEQGGAILHDNKEADTWFRKARFDGRTAGVAPIDDSFDMLGWHCYLSPAIAADGLMRLSILPKHNEDLPNDDYPDLSKIRLFQ